MTNYGNYDFGTGTIAQDAQGTTVTVGGLSAYYPNSPTQPPPPPSAAPAPALAPVFNQISPNTIGSVVMVSYGTQRLGGQPIWTTGIEANADVAQTGLVTGLWAFCEPADASEPLRIQKAWANGVPFYDFDVNPTAALTVANLTPAAQTALNACVANMVMHLGGPGELPDAVMASVLGEAETPAHRGLRTVRFVDFPTLISGNALPDISILFKRTDTILVRVDTCIQKIIDHYIFRTGIDVSFDVVGIDDMCYGATVTDQSTASDLLTQHKDSYNFQILDGNPIQIVRKAISTGLVVNLEVAEADIDRADGAPTVGSSRINPSQLPIGINWNYTDPDADFDTRMQPALHEGTAASTQISSVNSIFSVDKTTARQNAFGMLYRLRSNALRLSFDLDNVASQVSDIILFTANEGDRYTLLVQEATLTKSRSTSVQALALLTEAGGDIDGGDGLFGGFRNTGGRVVLLLNFDGANGSTTFTDESPAQHGNATVVGDTQVDTSTSVFGSGSGLFDGSGDALTFADSNDWRLTASRSRRFTVEALIFPADITSFGFIVGQWGNLHFFGSSVDLSWVMYQDGSALAFNYSFAGTDNQALLRGGTLTAGVWNAVAVDYDGTTVRAYINGVVVDSAAVSNLSFADGTWPLAIGSNSENTNFFFNGNMDVLRITKERAWYAGAYTPATTPFNAVIEDIITEDGEVIITEDGADDVVTEG